MSKPMGRDEASPMPVARTHEGATAPKAGHALAGSGHEQAPSRDSKDAGYGGRAVRRRPYPTESGQ
jgi:hypothetical protein